MANSKRDSMKGYIYLRKPDSTNSKAPFVKGFISISVELAQQLANSEPDSYGCVKLDVSVWKDEEKPGVLSGAVTPPYKKNDSTQRKPSQSFDDIDGI